MLTLNDLSEALATRVSMADAGELVAEHLARLVRFELCIFFLYDTSTDEVESRYCVGESASDFLGIRFPVGQRLSGWIAANRQSILNADPVLDLGDRARLRTAPFRSGLGVPLVCDSQLVGVLTVYSITPDQFTEDDRRIVEAVARQSAPSFRMVASIEAAVRREVTGRSGDLIYSKDKLAAR
jgi:GAF domain-containing protein